MADGKASSFPGPQNSARKPMTGRFRFQLHSPLSHALILLAFSLPYFTRLGSSSLWDANEAFYAETPREMLITGDYLAPRFNFQPRAQKPPLTYWAVLASYEVFGVNEFAVRFPGAMAAVGTLLFSYGLARFL
jgi:4-amino-4-deoxy-L-arabinose transferase-like glycosyltransferase